MISGGIIVAIAAVVVVAAVTIIWLTTRGPKQPRQPVHAKQGPVDLDAVAKSNVENVFDDDFREELRNRGRLHFEKVIGENAVFLQQDLRQTTSQLNEYMRTEISRTLQDEFKKYQQSIADAKQMALGSIEKTITTIDQQRQYLEAELQTQSAAQKKQALDHFEADMAKIVNHYILRAIGSQIDLSDQIDFILAEMESNKQAIIEDIQRGA